MHECLLVVESSVVDLRRHCCCLIDSFVHVQCDLLESSDCLGHGLREGCGLAVFSDRARKYGTHLV